MAIFTVTGDDTLVLNGRVFNDLATDDVTTITLPNELVTIKTGKDGNSIVSKNFQGYNGNLVVKVARGSSDDQFLNGIQAASDADFVGTALIKGSFSKRLGDGQGAVIHDVYSLNGGIISKEVEGKENTSGDIGQAEASYNIKFCDCRRSIQ